MIIPGLDEIDSNLFGDGVDIRRRGTYFGALVGCG
jgi:hypothetical protein